MCRYIVAHPPRTVGNRVYTKQQTWGIYSNDIDDFELVSDAASERCQKLKNESVVRVLVQEKCAETARSLRPAAPGGTSAGGTRGRKLAVAVSAVIATSWTIVATRGAIAVGVAAASAVSVAAAVAASVATPAAVAVSPAIPRPC